MKHIVYVSYYPGHKFGDRTNADRELRDNSVSALVARRGKSVVVYSDNGINFRCADKKMAEAIK